MRNFLKNQQTDPLEILDNLKEFIEQIEQESEAKAKAFKQALMILTSRFDCSDYK